jgi:hypothetical protein
MPNPREMADGLLEVRQCGCARFQNATGKNLGIAFTDKMTLYVHCGDDKSYLARGYERYSRPFAPTRSVVHYKK